MSQRISAMVRSVTVLSAVAALAASGVGASAESWASDDNDRGGMIHYEFDAHSLPGAQQKEVQGTLGEQESCEFEFGSLANTPEGHVEVGAEVSFKPDVCVITYAVAVYEIDEVPDVVIEEHFDGEDRFDSFTAGAVAEREAAEASKDAEVMQLHSASLATRYRDPLFITVTRATTTLDWTGTSSCISAATPSHDTYHLGATGWSRTSMTPTFTFDCAQAYANTDARFMNSGFCPTGNTFTNHTGTRVYGYPGGPSDYSITMTKSGGCNDLLHSNYTWTP